MQDEATAIAVQTRLEPDLFREFEAFARQNERSMAAELRLLVKEALAAKREEAKAAS